MLTTTQCWLILLGCITAEVIGSVCVKLSDSYRNIVPSVLFYMLFSVSMGFFPYALVRIELGIAYAVWSGVGMAATCVVGIIYFNEKATLVKIAGVLTIVLGVVILQIEGAADSETGESGTATNDDGIQTEKSSLLPDLSSLRR
mmetsp:Transcript_40324/g.121478  ORF Transcript_40324/g.121478 Transcript_40324/m.121478 type:complete len:144 (-) Transcript_40324:243-674(-)